MLFAKILIENMICATKIKLEVKSMNILYERIKKGEKLFGSIVSLTDPALCEILANAGFDYIWIDMEHTYISFKETLCHLNAARSRGVPAIVRVPQNDLTATKKVLEMDINGIIFPMVKSAKEAEDLIKMTLYPPLGNRGFGPMRAIGYGADNVQEYIENKSLRLCRFIQIESVDLIDDLTELVNKPYIDGFIFGPNDLSGSIGQMGNVYGEDVKKQINRAIDIIKSNGKYVGLAVGHTEDTLKYWSQFKVDTVVAGADWNYVLSEGRRTLDTLNKCF